MPLLSAMCGILGLAIGVQVSMQQSGASPMAARQALLPVAAPEVWCRMTRNLARCHAERDGGELEADAWRMVGEWLTPGPPIAPESSGLPPRPL